jgi:outer membrane protein assembly factor BamB
VKTGRAAIKLKLGQPNAFSRVVIMRYAFLLIAVVLLCPLPAMGQLASSSLVSSAAARQLGLERMWFTQLNLDRARGRMAGIHLHVSPTKLHTVFQIKHESRRYVFSQRDRNAFHEEIGVEEAKKQADEKVAELKAALEKAGKADAQAPAIETFVVPQITLYATSHRGMVHAIDGETGRTLWTTLAGNPGYPTTAAGANDNFVAVCNGSTLYCMLANDGKITWSQQTIGSPGAGPALSDTHLFVPMVNGQVESFLLENPKQPVKIYKSVGRCMVQPVVSTNSVAWPTDVGNLYVASSHGGGLRFRMQSAEPVTAPPAFLNEKVYAASRDGYVFCLGERKGNILWRFTTGDTISKSPIGLINTVYVVSDHDVMFAMDADSPVERWVASGISSYVAGNDKRLYCLDVRGNLTVLDAASGSRLGSLPTAQCDVPINNYQTDRIYLATSTGVIQALRETDLPFPLVHFQLEPQQKVVKGQLKEQGEKSEQKESPKNTDPFADPFNPGAAKPAAPTAAPPAAAGADPFAPSP